MGQPCAGLRGKEFPVLEAGSYLGYLQINVPGQGMASLKLRPPGSKADLYHLAKQLLEEERHQWGLEV